MAEGKRGLGKGLDALLGDYSSQQSDKINEISVYLIDTNQGQPRKAFDEEKLIELSESIKTYGMVQPIIVRENNGRYMIVAGERRFRAARMAGLSKVPVIIKKFDEKEILEVSLIENIQRENLNAIEESMAIKFLMDKYSLTQEEVSRRLAKSRSAVANTLRLVSLPIEIQELVKQDKIQAGHARAILSLKTKEKQLDFANIIVEHDLSVREAEAMAKKLNEQAEKQEQQEEKKTRELTHDLAFAQDKLRERLGTKVMIKGNEKKGKIVIEYYSKDDLLNIFDMITE